MRSRSGVEFWLEVLLNHLQGAPQRALLYGITSRDCSGTCSGNGRLWFRAHIDDIYDKYNNNIINIWISPNAYLECVEHTDCCRCCPNIFDLHLRPSPDGHLVKWFRGPHPPVHNHNHHNNYYYTIDIISWRRSSLVQFSTGHLPRPLPIRVSPPLVILYWKHA